MTAGGRPLPHGEVRKVVSVRLDDMIGRDTDSFYEHLNELVTGSPCDLEDIDERAVGVSSDGRCVLLEVTGVLSRDN